jgi:hypothetical protein
MLKREVTLIVKTLKYMPRPYMIAIVEVGEDYTDKLLTIKTNHCSMEDAQKDARDAGYQVIDELCDIVHTMHEVHIIVAVEPEGGEEGEDEKVI